MFGKNFVRLTEFRRDITDLIHVLFNIVQSLKLCQINRLRTLEVEMCHFQGANVC